ncbi:MAG: hypothetical protein A2V86_03020 [Deltaproteobacteria bacterium RBG_16_49_23]|nr:MAG: hypothetical protein A2V86_03020 [Deltaproteobacteria bacterium RBG_16_49_23]
MKIALKGMPRRSFLIVLGVTILMFFTFRWRAIWWHFLFRPKKGMVQSRRNRFVEGEKGLLSIVHGRNVEKAVRNAIDLIGGMEKLDVFGKSVLLKPNILDALPSPTTTHPQVVKAVAKILYEYGARHVLIGDMSAFFKLPTRKNMDLTSMKLIAEEVEAELVPFEERGWHCVDLPQGRFLKRVYVADALFEVDRIINLPVIKTHRSATYSIALKNFVGATHFRHRPYLVDRSHWEEVIAELNLAYTPDLNIIDGTRLMVEGGPWKGRAIDANLIIATGDRIAADVAGLGVLKHYSDLPQIRGVDVWEQRQVKRAIELGMGAKGKDEIELREIDLEPALPGFRNVMTTVKKAVFGEEE